MVEGFFNRPPNLKPMHIIEHTLIDAAKGATPEFQAMDRGQFMPAWKKVVTLGGGVHDYAWNAVSSFFHAGTQETMYINVQEAQAIRGSRMHSEFRYDDTHTCVRQSSAASSGNQ